jgi:uncharacterized membrane protein YdjX (TVP38/TMEM64 family)
VLNLNVWFDVEQVAEWIASFGLAAVAISILLNVAISLMGVVPSVFLSGANAVVFGLIPGFFISLIGEVVGAGAAFLLYRAGIRKVISTEKLNRFRWLARLNELTRPKQFTAIFLARLTPFMPSGLVNFVGATSNIRFIDFMLASFIGKIPSLMMETLIGHDLVYFQENQWRLALVLLILGVILIGYRIENKKKT